MSISEEQLNNISDFIDDWYGFYDMEWLREHITLKFDDITKTVIIEIWDIDEQDYKDLSEV